MKTFYVAISFLLAFLAVAPIAVAAFSQVAQSPPEPQPKKDHIVAPPASAEAKEPRPLENVVKLTKRADEQEIAVARLLKSQPTPPIRGTYFQSVLNDPRFRFSRWHLTILEVKSDNSVIQVKVRARLLLTCTASVHGFLDETYELGGEKLKLLKTDPPVDPAVPNRFIITRK